MGGGNHPIHVGEAIHEERRRSLENAMLRLEPCNEHWLAIDLPFAEAHEGVHAIHLLLYSFGVAIDAYDVGVRCAVEQMMLAVMNSPQKPIEEREPVRRAVTQNL